MTFARKWVKDYDLLCRKEYLKRTVCGIMELPWDIPPCSQVPREEIFLTTKIWADDFGWEKARVSCDFLCFISSRGVDVYIKSMTTNIGRELVTKLCGSLDICQSTYT